MDRRATLKFLASLPFVGLLFRPQVADASTGSGISWNSVGGPDFRLTSLMFAVTREELERHWVEQSPSVRVPDSGLIRRFRSAMEIYQNCRIPSAPIQGFPASAQQHDVVQPGRIHIEFQNESGKPWGQPHNLIVVAEEVFEKRRYAVIDRALSLLKLQLRRAEVPADLDTLKYVQVRFLHA